MHFLFMVEFQLASKLLLGIFQETQMLMLLKQLHLQLQGRQFTQTKQLEEGMLDQKRQK